MEEENSREFDYFRLINFINILKKAYPVNSAVSILDIGCGEGIISGGIKDVYLTWTSQNQTGKIRKFDKWN